MSQYRLYVDLEKIKDIVFLKQLYQYYTVVFKRRRNKKMEKKPLRKCSVLVCLSAFHNNVNSKNDLFWFRNFISETRESHSHINVFPNFYSRGVHASWGNDAISPLFQIPPISERFLRFVGNFPNVTVSDNIFSFSPAKISDDLFLVIDTRNL